MNIAFYVILVCFCVIFYVVCSDFQNEGAAFWEIKCDYFYVLLDFIIEHIPGQRRFCLP